MPVYVNNNYFSEQNNRMAYIMGFLAADGNVSKNGNRIQSQLSLKDKEHLEMIQSEIGGCKVYEYESNGYFYTYDDDSSGSTITYGGAGYYPQAGINFLFGLSLKF